MNNKGQLLLPMLAVIFLFGIFWIPYAMRCQKMYWTMRMDATADLVALSAARERAALLNFMATAQFLQSPLVPQVKGNGIASISVLAQFEMLNRLLRQTEKSFKPLVYGVAGRVARLNGSNRAIFPAWHTTLDENLSSGLEPKSLKVTYLAPPAPPVVRIYSAGYYARRWSPRNIQAQPDHVNQWMVCRDSLCSGGKAALWLDVELGSVLNNGGFPPSQASFLRSVGFQCFYPQFNARLLPKP